ncbi:putative serine/threonine-protein kinase [Colletotrichum fructicola]|nr:putative serine/threonine-protein kinase [Colletotrichum fructicola]KAF4933977.1 putative serine/threonine-protein kinase [Colletotrichum fructicola]
MDFSQSGFPTFRQKAPVPSPIDDSIVGSSADNIGGSSRCPHFAGFLSVCLSGDTDLGLHPFITNILPTFEDVTIGGGSFDVRKVKTSSFLSGLGEGILKGRDFVIVKHPKASFATAQGDSGAFADAATELQILRHPPLKGHDNIIELLAVMYHDTGEPLPGVPRIMPALVLEYAEHGSLKTFQEQGGGSSFVDQIQIAIDTAQGLKALHDCGIIHGDVKPSNLLVCRHETRSFIVKLSDFGFSLSSGDIHIIGHSEFFCAPESYGENIRPPYLEQLDIYCYGLTLLTIFESGSAFYDSFPTEGLEDNLRKMKSSGIMSTLIPLRVLNSHQNDDLPLMILCKIWRYSLQASPTRRFQSMDRILSLLEVLRHAASSLESAPSESGDGPPVQRALDSLRELTSKTPIIQGTPADVFSTVCHRLAEGVIGNLTPGSGSVRMPAIDAKKLHDTTAQVVQMLLLINKTAMQGDSFENSLYNLIEKRVMGGLVQACGGAREQQESTEVSVKSFVSFLVDLTGLTPDPGSISEQASAVSSQQLIVHDKLNFRRGLDFIPDLRNTAGIYQKMPKRIQKDLVQSLESICFTSTDDKLRAAAAFSIAVAHVNGVGVRFDINTAHDFLLRAAKWGHEQAQTTLINIFDHQGPPDATVPLGLWVDWLKRAAELGSDTALEKLKAASASSWRSAQEVSQTRRLESEGFGLLQSQQAVVDGQCEGQLSTSQSLVLAIIQERGDMVEELIRNNPQLLNQPVSQAGESPLLVACRLARVDIVKLLVNKQADASIGDTSGICPLHWLCVFPDSDTGPIAHLLHKQGGNPNALAVTYVRDEYLRNFQPRPANATKEWTPLHWAVAAKNLAAVDALLAAGSDPLFHADCKVSNSVPLNSLQMASYMCHSAILCRILQSPGAIEGVLDTVPMVQGKEVVIRPLFGPLQGSSRWSRLLRHGLNFEDETRDTISLLVGHGAPTDAVLEVGSIKMPAVYAVAFHQCAADVMLAGLDCGFDTEIDVGFGGETALFMAINHRDHEMVKALLDAGASATILGRWGDSSLVRAAKESDDISTVRSILETGVPIDGTSPSLDRTPFETAVYSGWPAAIGHS